MKRLCLLAAELAVLTFAFAQMASAVTTFYVTTDGTGDGSSWASPTNSIQGAIDAIEAGAGSTVWVSNGVYDVGGVANYPAGSALTNRISIWKTVTVRSANNDPTNTIIKGAKDNGTTGPAAVRCVYMAGNSALIGFTLTNGATLATADSTGQGGGVFCDSTSATISNCIVANNTADYECGGTYGGALYNCIVINNNSKRYGGGAGYGILTNCTIMSNSAGGANHGGGVIRVTAYNCIITGNFGYNGGGAFDCTLRNCTIANNSGEQGGGTFYCTVYDSIIATNRTYWDGTGGGGAQGGTLSNCTIVGNTVDGPGEIGQARAGLGGGVNSCTLYNCVIVRNLVRYTNADAPGFGGGAYNSVLYNCTIVSNRIDSGFGSGGAYTSTLYNCISWDNSSVDAGGTVAYYSCGVDYTGNNNISDNPAFANSAGGDYRLTPNSPCLDKGSNQNWMAAAVDRDGRKRIDSLNRIVDMGAYEFVHRIALVKVR